MSRYKDFQGKTLDDAISEACNYYGVEREKLEIEIVSDAKTGIFGLVGVKKATIRAARVQPPNRALLDDSPAEHPAAGDDAPAETGESGQRRRDNGHDKPRPGADKGRSARNARDGKAAPENAERAAASGQPSALDAGKTSADAGRAPSSGAGRPSGRDGMGSRDQARKQSGNAAGSGESAGAARARDVRPAPDGRDANGRSANGRDSGAWSGKTREQGSAPADNEADAAAPAARGRNRRDSGSRRDDGRGGRRNAPRADRERSSGAGALAEDDFSADGASESVRDEFPEFVLEGCDREALFATVSEVIRRLVEPIVGPAPCVVDIHDSRVRASIDCGEASGLLVGREGNTLAAVQYLASRIIAKRIGGSVRLQIDAGNYRERQDDRLKELALSLAERVKTTRRPQSTRPLSAYQRRIVHLALEGDEAVQTHSKGEGTQRRVIIQLKRAGRGKDAGAPAVDATPAPDEERILDQPATSGGNGGADLPGKTDFSAPDGFACGPEFLPEADGFHDRPEELEKP